MTLNEIAYFVAGRLNEPLNIVLVEEIKFAVNYWRAHLLKQEIERNGQIGSYSQSLDLPVILVDAADSCYIELGCKVLRTKDEIPVPINIKGGVPFNYVGAPTMKRPFGFRQHGQIALSFTGKNILYTITNNYLYIWGNNLLDYITVSGIFLEPNKAYNKCVNPTCDGDDIEYPCPGDIVKTIIDGLLSGTFSIRPLKNEILTRDGREE